MSSQPNTNPTSVLSRAELLWLAGAVIFGAILRLSHPGRMAIEHFDEGVYASNFWFSAEEGFSYPARHLYAPPLLPAAIEWTMTIASLMGIKPTGFVPMIPSLIAGIGTIPSIWWVGRKWFGPTAGLMSAWLIATSDFHACYSRAALTDVPVCFFMLWAVYFVWRAMVETTATGEGSNQRKRLKAVDRHPSLPWREFFLASGFTGLAWWTKYNGWLPLAIGLAGGGVWQFLTPPADRQLRRTLACWIWIAAISGVIWSPVVWGLQKQGGYAAVAANHRQYLVGLSGWGDSAIRQVGNVGFYDNCFDLFSEGFRNPFNDRKQSEALSDNSRHAVPVNEPDPPLDKEGRFVERPSDPSRGWTRFIFPVVLLAVSGAAIFQNLRNGCAGPELLSTCLIAAWFGGLTVATPFYHPYPRLVLPLMTAAWIGFGLAIHLWRNPSTRSRDSTQSPATKNWACSRVELILVVCMIVNCSVRTIQGTAHAWQERTSLQVVAKEIATNIQSQVGSVTAVDGKAIVYLWGEPALVFGLRANGVHFALPVADLAFTKTRPRLPTFLVLGKQPLEGDPFHTERSYLEACQLREEYRIHPSHLVVMDSLERTSWFAGGDRQPSVSLYRIRE